MKRYVIPLLMALLIGITVFTSFQYIMMTIDRQGLVNNLEEIKNQLSQLEVQKEAINKKLESQILAKRKIAQEKQVLEEVLKDEQEKYATIEEQLSQAQNRIDQLNGNLAKLEQENALLMQKQDNLTTQVEKLVIEKGSLEGRLNSLKELKNAIRELKLKMRKNKVVRIIKKNDTDKKDEGSNYGYLVRNGESTYTAKIKIEVTPAH